jgi:hypothetical protein
MDKYIDPRQQLIAAAQAALDDIEGNLGETERKNLCAALKRNRWTNTDEKLQELADRYAQAKTAQMQQFYEKIAQRHGAERVRSFKPDVRTSVLDDGRIEMFGNSLPPNPDLLATYPNGWGLHDYIEPRDAMHFCDVLENNIVRDYDENRLTDPNYPHASWQIIFKTKDGLDYCRETKWRDDTITEVEQFALQTIRNNDLGGAVIQFW